MDDDYSELLRRNFDGPVYYETRAGLMLVAYPKYFGTEVDQNSENRRLEFAKAITRTTRTRWSPRRWSTGCGVTTSVTGLPARSMTWPAQPG